MEIDLKPYSKFLAMCYTYILSCLLVKEIGFPLCPPNSLFQNIYVSL